MTPDYEAGDVIEYTAFGRLTRVAAVEERDPEIKNGQPGFYGSVTGGPENGLWVWGYDDQITRVVSRGDRNRK
jgi:hypothetical protein